MPLVTFDDRNVESNGWETIWTGTLRGGNTISADFSEYSLIKVFGVAYARQVIFEIDLTKAIGTDQSGYSYASTGTAEYVVSAGTAIERGIIECLVSTAKTTFWCRMIAYISTNGSTFNNRNNQTSSNYYVYRIDGYK